MGSQYCKLYDSCGDECASDELCSFGECIEQKVNFKSDYFIASCIYFFFGFVVFVHLWIMRKNTTYGCFERCFSCNRSTDEIEEEEERRREKSIQRPPVFVFTALYLLARGIWFLLLELWTSVDEENVSCSRTYEIETQYPTLIGLNIATCLFLFTMLSLVGMYLSKTSYDAQLRISTGDSEQNDLDSSGVMGVELYNYVYNANTSIWLWAQCRCVHHPIFFVIANFWAYVLGIVFWIYSFQIICNEDDSTATKRVYVFQVAAIAALFGILTLSFMDTMRRLTFLMKSLQMEKLPVVRRFVQLNRLLFSGAFVYLIMFNGTQIWRFINLESRATQAVDIDEDDNSFDSCHILYPHLFYTVPEIFLCLVLLVSIRPLEMPRLFRLKCTKSATNYEDVSESRNEAMPDVRVRGLATASLERVAERRALLNRRFSSLRSIQKDASV